MLIAIIMLNADNNFATFLSLWAVPLLVLVGTIIASSFGKLILKRVTTAPRLMWVGPLIPAISSLIYLVGIKLFLDVAPLPPKAVLWGEHAIFIISTLTILWIMRSAIFLAIEAGLNRKSTALSQVFLTLGRNLVTIFLFITALIMILKRFNYDVLSLLTALGVGSLAIGLAAKDTLAHMISGFVLIMDRNVMPGDKIDLGGTVGIIREIGLRSTIIATADGNLLIVPNSELVNTKILKFVSQAR